MAVEVNGAPLKFTAVFDSKKAERDIDAFYANLSKRNRELVDKQPASKVLDNIYKGLTQQIKNARNELDNLNKTAASKASLAGHMARIDAIRKTREELAKLRQEESRKSTPGSVSTPTSNVGSINSETAAINANTTAVNENDLARAKAANEATALAGSVERETQAQQRNNLTRKELQRLLTEERYIQQQNNRELRNTARENLNAKGSLEQRRAALIRLQIAYDRLSVSERESAYGQRLQGVIKGVNTQVYELEKATGRAQRNVGNYTSAFTKGLRGVWKGIRQIAYIVPGLGIAGVINLALAPLLNLISKLELFKKKLTEAEQASKILSESLGSTEYSDAIKNVKELEINIDQAKKGFLDKDRVVKQYNETLGKTIGFAKNINEAEQLLIDNANKYVEMTLYKAAAQQALEEASKKALEAEQKRLKNEQDAEKAQSGKGNIFSNAFSSAGAASVFRRAGERLGLTKRDDYRVGYDDYTNEVINQGAKAVDKIEKQKDEILSIAEQFQKRAIEISKTYGFNFFNDKEDKKAQNAAERAIDRQRKLQAKIDELVKGSKRTQLSQDQEEIKAIEDKYDKIRKVVDDFFKERRNKGLKVDISGLSAAEQREKDEIIAKQQLEVEKQTIEQKKALFDQYEEYKQKVGKDKANEAFKEDLQGFESYLQYLRSLMPKDDDTSVKANKTRDYLSKTAIPSAQKEQSKRDAELYRQSLIDAQTFADKIRAVQQRLSDDITRLKGKASDDQLEALKRNAREEISTITSAAIKQETQWDETFAVMANMSRKAAKEWIKNAERRLDYERRVGKLTLKEYLELTKQLNQADNDIDFRDPFSGLGSAIKKYREDVDKFGKDSEQAKESFRKMAAIASEAFQGVAQVIGSVAESFDKLGIGNEDLQETLGKVQELASGLGELAQGIASKNPVTIITGAIKTLTSVIDLFNTKDKKLQKQIEGYQTALKALERQYNQLQRAIDNSAGESYYDESALAIKNLQQQIKNLEAARNAEANKKKSDQDAIDGYTDQIIAANQAIEDLQKTISEQLLQTDFKQLSDSLASALLSAFEAGEDGIDALNKSFDQFIKNAVANSLKLKIIEPLIKDVTEQISDYMLKNDNSLRGFDFTDIRKELEQAGSEFTNALDDAYKGLGLSKEGNSTGSGLSGTIGRSITEDTANKWMGVQLNMYTISKNHYAEAQVQTKLQQSYLSIATRNLDAALGIERNTAATVTELKNAVGYLTTIANNTKQGLTGRDSGR